MVLHFKRFLLHLCKLFATYSIVYCLFVSLEVSLRIVCDLNSVIRFGHRKYIKRFKLVVCCSYKRFISVVKFLVLHCKDLLVKRILHVYVSTLLRRIESLAFNFKISGSLLEFVSQFQIAFRFLKLTQNINHFFVSSSIRMQI